MKDSETIPIRLTDVSDAGNVIDAQLRLLALLVRRAAAEFRSNRIGYRLFHKNEMLDAQDRPQIIE